MSEVSVLAAFADRVRIPSQHDQVHNEECLFSFDNPVKKIFKTSIAICNYVPFFVLNIYLHFLPLFLRFQESEDGLYICMERFLGFGRSHVMAYHQRTENNVFLHVKRRKVEKKKEDKDDDKDGTPDAKVSRMAIGVPGGFNPEEKKYEYDEKHNVVLIPEFKYFSLGKKKIHKTYKNCRDIAKRFIFQNTPKSRWRSRCPPKESSTLTRL